MDARFIPFLLCIFAAASWAQVSPHGPTKYACRTCHTTDSSTVRKDSAFDHTVTGFVLSEQHTTLECVSCHKRLKFSLQETNCISCHADVHKGKLGERCGQCHVTQAWLGAAMMRQHELGRFLLTGAHEAVPCKSCHVGGNFGLTFNGCQQCHDELWQKTTSPNHVTSGLSHDCMRCHSTKGWRPTTFDHSATRFSLTGGHSTASCHSCHAVDNYELQYIDCYQCHQTLFKQPMNPNHVLASFPHDCSPCHSTTAWRPSMFMHDQQNFRIFDGKHRNKWSACSDCHQNAANFGFFSCLACHDQNATNSHHLNMSGYAYASPACYRCHRDA
jgi:hypothetical protein